MPVQTTDDAVRKYLQFLQDPASLVDPAEVARLSELVTSATDPLARLRAVTDLQRIQHSDGAAFRMAFITHAKGWAEQNDIPVESFAELGVDTATLREAGFDVKHVQSTRGRGAKSKRSGSKSSNRPPVSADEIKTVIVGRKGKFTLADVAQTAGGSPMTVRKAVEELIRDGAIERIGPTPNWKRQGRAPILFQVTPGRARQR